VKFFGISGWSGSGKTTLLVKLIPELKSRGLKVSTIKHAHHRFDVDKPGKDSYRHRDAGATEVLISSHHRWALLHELENEGEPSLQELTAHMSEVDILLVEGFKSERHMKMEIHRPVVGKPLIATEDTTILGVATDDVDALRSQLPETVALLDLNSVETIADFVLAKAEPL
jgi:molybdopterin-guanine dinucleotide biosynthesis adapter protein